MTAQCVKQSGNPDNKGRLLRADNLRDGFRRKLRHKNSLTSSHKTGIDTNTQSETMENRQNGQDGIGIRELSPFGYLHALRDKIHIGKHNSLGHACRPAAI